MTDVDEDKVWRGVALLHEAEKRAWRVGFALGMLAGAAAILGGELLAIWVRLS